MIRLRETVREPFYVKDGSSTSDTAPSSYTRLFVSPYVMTPNKKRGKRQVTLSLNIGDGRNLFT